MPRYGVHGPRYFALLSSVREAAPADEWWKEAVKGVEETETTFAQRIKMRINGYVYIGDRMKPTWKAPIPHYMFKCPIHGLVIDYPHTHYQILSCPICRKERRER